MDNVQENQKYKKRFTKISHLTQEQRHERLKAQKRAWASRYKKTKDYQERNSLLIHKKKFKMVLRELFKNNEYQQTNKNKNNLKKEIMNLQRLLNKAVVKLNEINDLCF